MKWNRLILILCLIVVSFFGTAQTVAQTSSGVEDTSFVNSLLQQSKDLFTSDPGKAIALSMQAKTVAKKINFPKGEAIALKNIGLVNKKQGKYLEGLDYYHQSLKIYEAIKDNQGIANLYSNIGVIYYDRGDDTKALENYLQSLKFAEQAGDKFRILIALNNIGGIYYDKKATYDKALQYYLKALPLCEELGKKEELGAITVNIGDIYSFLKEDTKALYYYNMSLKAYGNTDGSLNVYNALGKLYKKEAKYDLALKNHNMALAIAQKINNKTSIAQSLMGLGNVYKEKKDYKTASAIIKKQRFRL